MRRRSFKKVTAIVLSICCMLTAIPVMTSVQAHGESEENVLNGDFEKSQGSEGIDGWKLLPCGTTGRGDQKQTETSWPGNYVISKETENNNSYMQLTPKDKIKGYVVAQSSYVTIQPNQTYTLSYDLKAEGSIESNGNNKEYAPRVRVYYYDSNKTYMSAENALFTYEELVDWKSLAYEYTAPENAAYITVNLYMGGTWNSGTPKHYMDNVNVQFDTDKQVLNGDFEYTQNSEGVHGWKLLPCGTSGRGDQNQNQTAYPSYYEISKVTEKDNSYMQLTPKDKIKGYVVAQSSYVTIQPNQTYTLSYDLKAEGSIESNGNNKEYAPRVRVYYYDSNKTYISAENALFTYEELVDWKSLSYEYTAPENAAYITVNLYMGGTWNSGTPKHYMDNVNVQFDTDKQVLNGDFEHTQNSEGVHGWKLLPCGTSGRGDQNQNQTAYPSYYEISKVTENNNSYMKLAPKDKIKGYVVAQSSYVTIQPNQTYTLSCELKAVGSSETNGNNKEFAPRVRVYYYDSNKTYLSAENALLTYEELVDWKSFGFEYTAPENAAYITVNLYMGGAWNKGPAEHYIDNVNVQFDSDKQVLNGDFEYTQNSEGVHGWKLLPCGTSGRGDQNQNQTAYPSYYEISKVTEKDNSYMQLTPKDKIKGYVVAQSSYVTIQPNQTYTLSYDLKAEGSIESNGNNKEYAPRVRVYYYDSNKTYISAENALFTYEELVDWKSLSYEYTAPENAAYITVNLYMGGTWNSGTPKHYIDNVNVQFNSDNPDSDVLPDSDEYRCTMKGATIRSNDSSRLRFVAAAPVGVTESTVTIKEMGIIVIPAKYIMEGNQEYKKDAALTLDNSYVTKLPTETYEMGQDFYVELNDADMNPNEVYRAMAYVVYECKGVTKELYSTNQHINVHNMVTAENGMCDKSVYGIAKEIAQVIKQHNQTSQDLEQMSGEEIFKFVSQNYHLLPIEN